MHSPRSLRAEETLRRALGQGGVDPRVRQNLALVVGLQGRFPEAESIARSDLPPVEAAANVAYLKQMLAQKGNANFKKTIGSRTVQGLSRPTKAGSQGVNSARSLSERGRGPSLQAAGLIFQWCSSSWPPPQPLFAFPRAI